MLHPAYAAALGVVQGLTEFLPVSSSGHLVLSELLLEGVTGAGLAAEDNVAFNLVLHMGTLLPVLFVYRADVWRVLRDLRGAGPFMDRPGMRLAAWVVLGTIPTGLMGVLLKDLFDQLFSTGWSVGVAFALTGALLWRTRSLAAGGRDLADMTWRDALIIGVAQGIAITPGISRSGTTIAIAMMLGLNRELAARYSFLLSVPAILGAFVLEARHLDTGTSAAVLPLMVGFAAAALSGYAALIVLLRLVRSGDFSRFAWYLWPMSVVAIAVSVWRTLDGAG